MPFVHVVVSLETFPDPSIIFGGAVHCYNQFNEWTVLISKILLPMIVAKLSGAPPPLPRRIWPVVDCGCTLRDRAHLGLARQ